MYGLDEMEHTCVSLDHPLARFHFCYVRAGEDIAPNALLAHLGGADIVYWGAGTEGKESGLFGER